MPTRGYTPSSQTRVTLNVCESTLLLIAIATTSKRWRSNTSDGVARFASDPYRRYGTLAYGGDTWYEPTFIDVQVRSINGALAGILERESEIDILKIDTEGLEERLVGVLDEELLRRIRTIVYETDDPAPYHTARFRHSFACETNRLEFR